MWAAWEQSCIILNPVFFPVDISLNSTEWNVTRRCASCFTDRCFASLEKVDIHHRPLSYASDKNTDTKTYQKDSLFPETEKVPVYRQQTAKRRTKTPSNRDSRLTSPGEAVGRVLSCSTPSPKLYNSLSILKPLIFFCIKVTDPGWKCVGFVRRYL